MKKALAMSDNCVDIYPKLNRFYVGGNSIDFAFNYHDQGGAVTLMTILGNDIFAKLLANKIKERHIPLRIMKEIDQPTGVATMDLQDNDKIYLDFSENALSEIVLNEADRAFISGFDIVYGEQWTKLHTFIKEVRRPQQIWLYDFSTKLDEPTNDLLLPYLDYAFFSYEQQDTWIRDFLKETHAKGAGCVIAMLGAQGSLAYDGERFHEETAKSVEVVNTVGAGDAYIAGFAYGLSLEETISECMKRGKTQATKIIQQFEPYLS